MQQNDENCTTKGIEVFKDTRSDVIELMGDIVKNSAEKALKAFGSKSKMDNIAIFVDYDNVYWELMNKYGHDPDHKDNQKNLFVKLWDLYGRDNIRLFKVYGDFQQIKTSLTNLQRKRIQIRHVYANDKTEDKRKNASDIELCIDAIETTYKDPSITCYVFVTADSDMIPIMSRLMYKGKYVILFYIQSSAPKNIDITSYAHESIDLLPFLNVDTKTYDIIDYIPDAIKYIDEWHKLNANKNKYLGNKWLRDGLSAHLTIPSEIASRLLDQLKSEKLIIESYVQINNMPNQNWVINYEHPSVKNILETISQAAAT